VVRASSSAAGESKEPPWKKKSTASAPAPKPATVEERKRQLQQLADMGVAIPEEYRRDMTMVGDWHFVSETKIMPKGHKKEDDDEKDTKPEALSFGVKKRKLEDGAEGEEETVILPAKNAWGSTFKTHAVSKDPDEDLDVLLGDLKNREKVEETLNEAPNKDEEDSKDIKNILKLEDGTEVKKEEGESGAASSGVVFKKRKKKA
jgi:hypothetical protein